jgi:hypothetical protein
MFGEGYEALLNCMSGWEGFEKYLEPIKHFKDIAITKILKTYSPSLEVGAINVLNHGDFHFKNMLYKMGEDGGKIADFMMVRIGI